MGALGDPDTVLGLALSGGGFRASLFHIGVLARLAERDLLKHVQVLSTVSGGSIVGAYYYLKVKQLLEGKLPDHPKPSREAYVAIVEEMSGNFLKQVQKNIRMRTFLSPIANARMLCEDYSRSDRIAELYSEYFYHSIWTAIHGEDASREIYLKDIKIAPAGRDPKSFDLDKYNKTEEFKIPVLTINATTLNTGHPWHFTSSWVGEPGTRHSDEQQLYLHRRLEQLRFDGKKRDGLIPSSEQQKKLNTLTLGDAVAASAAVPGIFKPLAIHDLYTSRTTKKEIVVQLVDGGVFDNQGLDALFDANCTHIICSDASGQMEDELAPSPAILPVVGRTNSILMDRVRAQGLRRLSVGSGIQELCAALEKRGVAKKDIPANVKELGGLREYCFFHLKETFSGTATRPAIPGPADRGPGLVYRLSNLRTDLDSFTDIEGYTLMYDGYGLTDEKIGDCPELDKASTAGPESYGKWNFLGIVKLLNDSPEKIEKHLKAGSKLVFKVFWLKDVLAILFVLPFIAAAAAGLYAIWELELTIQFTVGGLVMLALRALVAQNAVLNDIVSKVEWLRNTKKQLGRLAYRTTVPAILACLVSVVVWIHLNVFDWRFIRIGRVESKRP